MDSKILDMVGLDIDPMFFIIGLLIFNIVLLVFLIVTSHKLKTLSKKYEKLMSGKDGESLEETINSEFEKIDKLSRIAKRQQNEIADIDSNQNITLQKVGIVKYDAFNEMGGKLSFALAILNKENTGFVINAMHSREGCYTYIKEIINGKSYILLGNEEKQAVDQAINMDNFMEQE